MADFKSTRLYQSFSIPFRFVLLLWIIHLFQFITRIELGWLGVYPGHVFGLKGILFAPLIHADWGHLISNTPPLFFISVMVMYFYRRVAFASFTLIYLLTGLAVWIFGREVFHIGASGVIYGLVAFVFWTGIFRRNLKSIVLALIVVFYYSSMFMGILPNQEGISWESHLLGALAGIFVSFWFRSTRESDEEPKPYSWEIEGEQETEDRFFLDRDAFEKTKTERHKESGGSGGSGWFSTKTWE